MYACSPGTASNLTTPAPSVASSGGIVGQPQFSFLPNAGLGVFDGGILNFSSYGLTEWLIVGGGLFLALGGMKSLKGRGGMSAGKRRSLRLLKAKYDLARAEA